jgi:dethiobiotin synthetase
MAAGFFITGTDTGVGKTLVACALLHAFRDRGKSAVGMKPVGAGRENGRCQDAEALAHASNLRAPEELANPYAFEFPIAPHIAAELDGVEISIDNIATAYAKLARLADVVIVEGAGGFMIPLNPRQTSADLARLLALPVILVVGMRLGCLNHALLTRRAIEAIGVPCAGWVANCIVPQMPYLDRNIRTLKQRLDCPYLGTIPHHAGISPQHAAALIALPSLAASYA